MQAPLDPALLGFRPLDESDLPLMHGWLNEPGDAFRWYGEERPTTLDEVRAEYLPMLHAREPARPFLILYGERPIGYIQRWDHRDWPVQWGHLQMPDAAGIDLFIGETDFLHRGLGPHLIRRFLVEHVFSDPAIGRCTIDPNPANRVAIRAYEKAGYRWFRTVQPPEHVEKAYLMLIRRDEMDLG
jgi:RimJ/RimL family protein N-acetyltransferase